MSERRRITLATGDLEVAVTRADWPLDALCDFACRANSKRGFLIVSKVLGRHIPTAPATMRATCRDLAARLPADLPGPVLVVGLAETAVCLGQLVHEELCLRTGRNDLVYLHSTRHQLDRPVLARFDEAHSHAPSHILYRPSDAGVHTLVGGARSLVLVDDEASTGRTFVNLACALAHLPRLERIATAVLTDWSGGGYLAELPWPAMSVSLLAGRVTWNPKSLPAQEPPQGPSVAKAGAPTLVSHNYGRLGRADVALETSILIDDLALEADRPVLVLGTGEFTFPPFRLAERLERRGARVRVQAVTRSPVRLSGAIQRRLVCADNYGEGVTNYLYNYDPSLGEQVIVCHETPPGSLDPALLAALDGKALPMGAGV